MKAELRRLPYLDSARGIAALSVITWHCYTTITNHPENTSLYTSPFHFFLYGEADMIFFFIHSGFILSYSHPAFENSISWTSYLQFIIRRIFRIYPLFLFILFLSFLLKNTIYPIPATNYLSSHFLKFWSNMVQFPDLIKQGLLAVRIPSDPESRLLPQDWTLSIEVLICPLIPFLNFLNRRFKLLSWLVIILLLKVFHFNTYLFEFAVGVNLYFYRHQITYAWNKFSKAVKIFCLAVAVILYTCFFGYPNLFDGNSKIFSPVADRLMVVTGCSIFFIFILNSKSIQNIFNLPGLVKIGKICYSLYVNHILLLICFSNPVLMNLHRLVKGPEWLIILLYVLLFQLLTILLSFATYRLIEKPFNKWGKELGIYFTEFYINRRKKSVTPVS
jgi:peptidoglycan/LPS O-acetylase OafA/YrhL